MANNRKVKQGYPIFEQILDAANTVPYSPDGSKVETLTLGDGLTVTDGVLSAEGGGGGGDATGGHYTAECVVDLGISSTREGLEGHTSDDIELTDGMVIFFAPNAQSLVQSRQSGLWIAREGPWERPEGWENGVDATGRVIRVLQGTNLNNTTWRCTSNPSVIGTDRVTWVKEINVRTTDETGTYTGYVVTGPGQFSGVLAQGDDTTLVAGWVDGIPSAVSPSVLGYATISGFVDSPLAADPDEYVEFDIAEAPVTGMLPGITIDNDLNEVQLTSPGLYEIYFHVEPDGPGEVASVYIETPGTGNAYPSNESGPAAGSGRFFPIKYHFVDGTGRFKVGFLAGDSGVTITTGTTITIFRVG